MSPSPPRLGQLLVDLGFIDEVQLDAALHQQQAKGGRLGKILVDNAVITEDRLTHALSRQLGIDSCDPVETPVHPKVLELIPSEIALDLRVMPMARKREGDADVVYVALSDPLDQRAMEAVRQALGNGARVHWMIAGESEMELALEKKYGRPAPHPSSQERQAPSYYQGVPVVQGLPFKTDLPQRRGSGSGGPAPASAASPPAARSPSALFGKPGDFDLQTDFQGPQFEQGRWSGGDGGAQEDGLSYEAFGTLQSADVEAVDDDFEGIDAVDIDDHAPQEKAVSLDLLQPDDVEEAASQDIEPLEEAELLEDVEPLTEEESEAEPVSSPPSRGGSDVVSLPASPGPAFVAADVAEGVGAVEPEAFEALELELEAAEPAVEALDPEALAPMTADVVDPEALAPMAADVVDPEAPAPTAVDDSVLATADVVEVDGPEVSSVSASTDDADLAPAAPREVESASEDLPEFSPEALSDFSERLSDPPPVVATRAPSQSGRSTDAGPPSPGPRKPSPRERSAPNPSLKWGDLLDGLSEGGGKTVSQAEDAPEPRPSASVPEVAEPDPLPLDEVEAEAIEEPTSLDEVSAEAIEDPTSLDDVTPLPDVDAPADQRTDELPAAFEAEPSSDVEMGHDHQATLDVLQATEDVELASDAAEAPFEEDTSTEASPVEAEPSWAAWVRETPSDALRRRLAAASARLAEHGLYDPERLEAEGEDIQAKNDVRLE